MKSVAKLTASGATRVGLPVGAAVRLGRTTGAAAVARLTKAAGGQLQVNGQPFRFSGTNIYWLALNDNATGGTGTFVSDADIKLALDQAVSMGATVLRIHTLGISVGKTNTMMPSVGSWNDGAVERADFVVSEAGKRGLKLMVPTTDRWDYYHGGGLTLAKLVLGSSATITDFYTNTSVRTAHKAYLSTLLNHVNRYTGLRWGADPTLAVWETGNECYDMPAAFHADISAHLKSLAPLALVADGTGASGMHVKATAGSNGADMPGLADTNTDILTGHFYDDHRMDITWMTTDATAARAAGKAYIVGEYDWTDTNNNVVKSRTSATRAQWLAAIEGNGNVSGDLYWSLEVDKATVGTHRDGYELYADSPENSEQTAGRAALAQHATAMTAASAATGTGAATVSANETLRQSLLGIPTGQSSRLPFNSGVNPAGRAASFAGYEGLSDAIETMRGVPFDVRTGFQYQNRNVSEGATAWNDLIGMQLLDWFDPTKPAILGMEPFPTGGSYTAAAAGTYDTQLVSIGQTIASKRPAGTTAPVILRLAWEMNGNWYPHAAFDGSYALKADYVAGSQRIITKIRQGAGSRVKFVQCWSASGNTRYQQTYWGDAYADLISIDVYDAFAGTTNGIHSRANLLATGLGGMFDYARAHGKLVGLDEWGGHNTAGEASNGNDNADFPGVFYDWVYENRDAIAYEAQFNDTATGNVENNLWATGGTAVQLPNQRAAYIAKVQSLVGLTVGTTRDSLVIGVDKPTASNTGALPGTTFTVVNGDHTPTSGTTYRDLDIRGNVVLKDTSNVTYINCYLRGANSAPTAQGALIKAFDVHGGGHQFIDCTVRPQYPHTWRNGMLGYGVTLLRCDLSYLPDVVEVFNTADPNGPCGVRIEQCYMHDHAWFPQGAVVSLPADGVHADAVQWEGGSGLIFRGNVVTGLLAPEYTPNYYGTNQANAGLMLKPDVGLIGGGVIDKNWLDGGSFTINIADDAPDRYVTNIGSISSNRFGRQQRIQGGGGDNTYTISMPSTVTGTFVGNVYDDTSAPVNVRHNG